MLRICQMRPMPILMGAGVLGMSLSGSGCRPAAVPSGPPVTEVAPVPLVHPQRCCLSITVEQPGSVQADEETQLYSQVQGYVKSVRADIGQRVQADEVLLEIDVPVVQAEVNQKRAQLRQAEAEVEQAKTAVLAAEAAIAAAEAAVVESRAHLERWESELQRISRLVQNGSLDSQSRDEALHQWRVAQAHVLAREAAVKKARADREKARADLGVAEARVAAAAADVRRLETLLAYAVIRAPFDGIVTRRQVNTGDLVMPNGTVGHGLFSVARINPVRVVIQVPEAEAALVQPQTPARLWIKALQHEPITATVSRMSWSLEPGPRTLRVECDLPNPKGQLRPGMYVWAQLQPQTEEVWTLPLAAILKRSGQDMCFFIRDGRAVAVTVRTGRNDGRRVEVRQWQELGQSDRWRQFDGSEPVAAQPAGLSDGQPVAATTE